MKPHYSLLTLLAFCQVSFAFEPIVYDAKQGTPEQQGWSKIGGLEAKVVTAEGHTFLDVDDLSPTDGVTFNHGMDRGSATEASESGFVFEVYGRIEPSSGPTSQQAEFCLTTVRGVLVLACLDNKQSAGLIFKDAQKPIFSHLGDSDFHVWKVIGKPTEDGSSLRLSFYADKECVGKELVPMPGAMPHVSFGATGGNMASRTGHVLYEKVILRSPESGE